MEAGRVAFDTDVLVDHLRGKTQVLLKNEGAGIATTAINAFELYYGAYKSGRSETNVAKTETLISSLIVLPLDALGAESAGKILAEIRRGGEDLEMRDLLIGCTAKARGYSLVTNNVKHFQKIPGLRVLKASELL